MDDTIGVQQPFQSGEAVVLSYGVGRVLRRIASMRASNSLARKGFAADTARRLLASSASTTSSSVPQNRDHDHSHAGRERSRHAAAGFDSADTRHVHVRINTRDRTDDAESRPPPPDRTPALPLLRKSRSASEPRRASRHAGSSSTTKTLNVGGKAVTSIP